MSFMQKLCDVYDAFQSVDGNVDNSPAPVGFIQKNIKYNILLTPSGEFETAYLLAKQDQSCMVPTLPDAEGRSSSKIAPFPLAEQLKYLIANNTNARFDSYIDRLESWCAAPHAPECLCVLLLYLKKKTLYADLFSVFGPKFKYCKDENDTIGKGADAKSIACFSIAYSDSENRLWMREDVRSSWTQHFAFLTGENTQLCYVSGMQLPIMKNHPKLISNAKLISSEDKNGFPFRYRGRFIDDGSAAAVSVIASSKAHNALKWLLAHQGLSKYGMHFVGWNTQAPVLNFNSSDDEPMPPDTFEPYINALFKSVQGYEKEWKSFTESDDITDEAKQRMQEVVILGMQAATDGRMSVAYEQELPGNVFVEHINSWRAACRWQMPHQEALDDDRCPTWKEICEAIMGVDAVQTARGDFHADKSAAKLMRGLQLRLLHCTVDSEALPLNLVKAAFNRAVHPLTFTNTKGKWLEWSWRSCVATACAMIRKHEIDLQTAKLRQAGKPIPPPDSFAPLPVLDVFCTNRDYLYGRLLAAAHKIELDASNDKNTKPVQTNAVRMMPRFVEQPNAVWPLLYTKLIPYFKTLGNKSAFGKTRSAHSYQRLLGQIESLFAPQDLVQNTALSFSFLIGFSAQTRELWLKEGETRQIQPPSVGYEPPQSRDELFGCLLAVADYFEWRTEAALNDDGRRISGRDGRTNALTLTAAFAARPMTTWEKIHDKLIPYLEKSGVRTARYAQCLLSRIEQCFVPEERLSDAPLGRSYLHGYLTMLNALDTADGLNQAAWQPVHVPCLPPPTREAAFGALLALENETERRVLDLEKSDDENRPGNAMRFMTRAAQRPAEVWAYLDARMRPYEKKVRCFNEIFALKNELKQTIDIKGFHTDQPLGPEYLHFFYLYSPIDLGKDD